MLLSGHAEVLRREWTEQKVLGYLAAGDLAGEMSLVTGQPAIATVRAGSKCFAIELPAADFLTILRSRPSARDFIQEVVGRRTQRLRDLETGTAELHEGQLDLV
jgi:CRP-like cAMP-binding protein